MKFLFLFLISFSANAMWIRVTADGTIMDSSAVKSKPELDIEIVTTKIQDIDGNYIYKYVNGSLIPLSDIEKNNHPYVLEKSRIDLLEQAKKNALIRLQGCKVVDFPDQFMKDLCLQYKEIK